MPKTLMAIGECMIELAPQSDDLFAMGFAGDTFNTAWYAKALAGDTLDVAYLSAVGDDDPSRRMARFMRDAGIRPVLSTRPDRSVGLYMISLKDGERSFSYWRATSAARCLAEDLAGLDALETGDVAFFSGITLAILDAPARATLLERLAAARARGVTVAFDPNLRPRLWPDAETMCTAIMAGAEVTDIALPSFEDERDAFSDADIAATAARYRTAGAQHVVVKNGSDPMLLLSANDSVSIPVAPVSQVVDSTAAGDSFNAGCLVSLMRAETLRSAVQAGSDLARNVICAKGALVAGAVRGPAAG